MSNHHWACFACRTVTRRNSLSTNVRCRECRRPCESLGYKTPIPPRYKVKEWEALFRYVNDEKRAGIERVARWKREYRRRLAERIHKLEDRPASKARAQTLRVLRRELDSLVTAS